MCPSTCKSRSKITLTSLKGLEPKHSHPLGIRQPVQVKRIHCRNTVHKDTGAWKATPNPESTGATGAARWVALGRPEVDAMQGKLKFQKTPEEEAQRDWERKSVNSSGWVCWASFVACQPCRISFVFGGGARVL